MRSLLWLGAIAQFTVSVWLLYTIVFVLPSRGSQYIPFWILIMAFFLLLGVLTAAYVRGRLSARGQWLVSVLCWMAILLGTAGVVDQAVRAVRNLDFEGYIVLMGIILAGHSTQLLFEVKRNRRFVFTP